MIVFLSKDRQVFTDKYLNVYFIGEFNYFRLSTNLHRDHSKNKTGHIVN